MPRYRSAAVLTRWVITRIRLQLAGVFEKMAYRGWHFLHHTILQHCSDQRRGVFRQGALLRGVTRGKEGVDNVGANVGIWQV